jgi:hypothetical protein
MNPNNPFISTNLLPLRSRYLSTAVTSVDSVARLAIVKAAISSGRISSETERDVARTYHIGLNPGLRQGLYRCQTSVGRTVADCTAADPNTDLSGCTVSSEPTSHTSRRTVPLQPSLTRPRHRLPYTPIILVLAPQASSSHTVHAR